MYKLHMAVIIRLLISFCNPPHRKCIPRDMKCLCIGQFLAACHFKVVGKDIDRNHNYRNRLIYFLLTLILDFFFSHLTICQGLISTLGRVFSPMYNCTIPPPPQILFKYEITHHLNTKPRCRGCLG